jgi:hypothetical protein
MKVWLAGLLLLIGPASAQQAVPVIAFDSAPNALRLPPNMYLGEVSGVSVNSKGHIFVLSRGNTTGPAYAAAATQLLELEADAAAEVTTYVSRTRLQRLLAVHRRAGTPVYRIERCKR